MKEETRKKGVLLENNILTRLEENSTKKIFAEFNKCFVAGVIETELEYSHEVYGKKFYRTRVRVKRLSGVEDLVPLIIPNLLIGEEIPSLKGKWVEVAGKFRSHRKKHKKNGHRPMDLFLSVTSIKIYDEEHELEDTNNLIYLDGYLCKPPIYREIDKKWKITDFLIAVNRAPYDKSDYIPCIAWGKGAHIVRKLEVGDRIQLYGRVQSREYVKRYAPDSEEHKTAYEISASRITEIN